MRGPKSGGPFDPRDDLLFVGIGATPVAYYRAFLPAMALGADWTGVIGEPPDTIRWVTGLIGKESRMPDMLNDYKVVVLQQVSGDGWLTAIRNMRERGVVVLYEIDDYVHGVPDHEDHDFKDKFKREYLKDLDKCMRECDGIIVSTPYLAQKYRKNNRHIFVARNGIDLSRYDLTRPKRGSVNIGWSGGTGHLHAAIPWLQQLAHVMSQRRQTCFISIGQSFARPFADRFGPERAIAVPFAAIEQYPSAMTMFDVALAPARDTPWYRGKSDLRWLESGALGIPLIADPLVYPDLEDGVTGFHAHSPQEMTEKLLRLVDDGILRTVVGERVRRVIRETRSIDVTAQDWVKIGEEVLS